MPKHLVTVGMRTTYYSIQVEANTEDEAKDKARRMEVDLADMEVDYDNYELLDKDEMEAEELQD